MTFARLRAADWVAMLAALALLFVSAADWYSTATGEEARRVEKSSASTRAELQEAQDEARIVAEGQEKNAWQASGAVDRLILICLLGCALLGIIAGFARASGRRANWFPGPSGLTALVALGTALLVLYRMVQEPGFDESTTVKAGAPLALVVLGVLALACAQSLRQDDQDGARQNLQSPA